MRTSLLLLSLLRLTREACVCEKVNGLKKTLAHKENDMDKEIEAAESVVENLEKVVEALTAATANAVAELAKAKKSSDGLAEEQQAEEAREEEEGGEGYEPEHVADPETEADAVGDTAVEQAFRTNEYLSFILFSSNCRSSEIN
jgi:hypothetical protein